MFKYLKMNDCNCSYNNKKVKKQIIPLSDFDTYTLPSDLQSTLSIRWAYKSWDNYLPLTITSISDSWIVTSETPTEAYVIIEYISTEEEKMSNYATTIWLMLIFGILLYISRNTQLASDSLAFVNNIFNP
jgi:hypothetical protein